MKLILAGGGTGGHLFPGIAIAQEALNLDPKSKILFIGSPGGLDAQIVPAHNFQLEVIPVGGLKRVGILKKIKTLILLPISFFKSCFILRRFKPDLVLGLGGYSSGPVLLAAKLFKYPTGILENNSVSGFTNRMLGKIVDKVFIAFENAEKSFKTSKVLLTGNPVRSSFAPAPLPNPSEFTLGILGGSQGARRINQILIEALPRIPENIHIIHQTGKLDYEWVKKSYLQLGREKEEVFDFIIDMPNFYRRVSLVICRSGATTISELAATHRPAIFIPFPFASDNHQFSNAESIERINGGKLIQQSNLTAEKLVSIVNHYHSNFNELEKMAQNISTWHKLNSSKKILEAFQ